MQIQIVDTSAGTAICAAPSRIAWRIALPSSRLRFDVFDFDRRVVDQDADRQRQAAERHDVDGLAQRAQHQIEVRIESGMETAMISVLRQLPRKIRIMMPVRPRQSWLRESRPDRRPHEDRLIGQRLHFQIRAARVAAICGSRLCAPATISSVEALPVLRIDTSAPRWPSSRTMLVCGAKPSRTWATSRR